MLHLIKNFGKNINIFVYVNNKGHLRILYNIVKENIEFNFFIYANKIDKDSYLRDAISNLPNIYWIDNLESALWKICNFGLFIGFELQSCRPHKPGLRLLNFFKKFEIKCFEIQHGFVQLGMHYFSEAMNQSIFEDSLYNKSFADGILSFYSCGLENEFVIGYPPFHNNKYYSDICIGEFTLIMSNMHWKQYSIFEKINFYRTIFQFISCNNNLYIWRLHPAEQINENIETIKKVMSEFPLCSNHIHFQHNNPVLSHISLDHLIENSSKIITSLSTVILDCETHNKDYVVYKCDSNCEILNEYKNIKTFTNFDTLCIQLNNQTISSTGKTQKYDNSIFQKVVKRNYRVPQESNQSVLDKILNYL